ncbi:hypothetical protein ABW19_dt0209799 [Dactylella cylindrospora]|nr:hypothetical protein ABW19_dt0209799 [Dactylella cylindrospora]
MLATHSQLITTTTHEGKPHPKDSGPLLGLESTREADLGEHSAKPQVEGESTSHPREPDAPNEDKQISSNLEGESSDDEAVQQQINTKLEKISRHIIKNNIEAAIRLLDILEIHETDANRRRLRRAFIGLLFEAAKSKFPDTNDPDFSNTVESARQWAAIWKLCNTDKYKEYESDLRASMKESAMLFLSTGRFWDAQDILSRMHDVQYDDLAKEVAFEKVDHLVDLARHAVKSGDIDTAQEYIDKADYVLEVMEDVTGIETRTKGIVRGMLDISGLVEAQARARVYAAISFQNWGDAWSQIVSMDHPRTGNSDWRENAFPQLYERDQWSTTECHIATRLRKWDAALQIRKITEFESMDRDFQFLYHLTCAEIAYFHSRDLEVALRHCQEAVKLDGCDLCGCPVSDAYYLLSRVFTRKNLSSDADHYFSLIPPDYDQWRLYGDLGWKIRNSGVELEKGEMKVTDIGKFSTLVKEDIMSRDSFPSLAGAFHVLPPRRAVLECLFADSVQWAHTPLKLEAKYGHDQTLLSLLVTHDLREPLRIALRNPWIDWTQQFGDGKTCLHLAASIPRFPIIGILITGGHPVQCVDEDLNTPLHSLLNFTRSPQIRGQLVKYLNLFLSLGVPFGQRNWYDRTAFEEFLVCLHEELPAFERVLELLKPYAEVPPRYFGDVTIGQVLEIRDACKILFFKAEISGFMVAGVEINMENLREKYKVIWELAALWTTKLCPPPKEEPVAPVSKLVVRVSPKKEDFPKPTPTSTPSSGSKPEKRKLRWSKLFRRS